MHIKKLYKLLILSAFLVLPFNIANAVTDSVNSKEIKKPLEWLFVVTANNGEIKRNEKQQYVLILTHTNVKRILAFTEKPNRIVKHISTEQFKNLWGVNGQQSFKKDPPNAVIAFDRENMAIILTSVNVSADKITFVIKSDDDKIHKVKMRDVVLLIDGYRCPIQNSICGP